MKKRFVVLLVLAILFTACGEVMPTQQTESPRIASPISLSTQPIPPDPLEPSESTEVSAEIPKVTFTPSPMIDSQGNVSWHPQEVLIASEVGGGDGVGFDYPPEFVLLWDGTLFQKGANHLGAPFVSHLEEKEICKILNTVDASGFFDEPREYRFPFDGLGSEYITVNGWRSHSSGSQILTYALSGAPYYDGLFCRGCPIPSEETIIQPGLANVYFLLKDYFSPNRTVAPVDKIIVYFYSVDDQPTHEWPITSISTPELLKRCEESYCYDVGMTFDGDVAREFEEKIDSSQVFVLDSFMGSMPFRVSYRAVWPYEPSIMYYSSSEESDFPKPPMDYTLTCNTNVGIYPILPFSKENKFWFYAPNGKWGAEVVEEPGQFVKIRVINKSGYEKYYQYDPALFGQISLKVFPRFWTEDSEYFFANILPGDFDAQESPFVNSIGLQRISISDGKVDYMFAGVNGQQFAFAMSEDGTKLVYIRQSDQPLRIIIKDTRSLDEKSATLLSPSSDTGFYTDAGTITSSVDERTFFVAAIYSENNMNSGVIISVDASNPTIQNIVYKSSVPFKLNQSSYHDWNASVCPLDADIEEYCDIRFDLEAGTIE